MATILEELGVAEQTASGVFRSDGRASLTSKWTTCMLNLRKVGAVLGSVMLLAVGGLTPAAAQTTPGQTPPMPTDMGDPRACAGESSVRTFSGFSPRNDGRYNVGEGGTGTMVYYAKPCNGQVKAALDFAVLNRYANCQVEVVFFTASTSSVIRKVSGCTSPGAAPPLGPGESFNSGNGAQGIAQRFAPAVYLSPGEGFMPSSIDYFAKNAQLECNDKIVRADLSQIKASDRPADGGVNCFLVPKTPLSGPYDYQDWLHAGGAGASPVDGVPAAVSYAAGNPPPVYIFFYTDRRDPPSQLNFIAQYMMFFPFNYGKNACMGLAPSDHCLVGRTIMGNHVGDWEIVTIRFVNAMPKAVHVGAHGNEQPDTASTYFCCDWKDPSDSGKPALEWMGEHPIVYAADGSHGIYGWAAQHNYLTLKSGDKMNDYTGKGMLWRTWNKIDWPTWTTPAHDVLLNKFKGRWGSHHLGMNACHVSGMQGFCGIAGIPGDEYQMNDGPTMPEAGRDREFVMSK